MGNPDSPRVDFPAWAWSVGTLLVWGVSLACQGPSIAADDSGETVTAAWTLGIPHPPGHPLVNLLARLSVQVPLGDPAFRMNLFSAAAVILAAALLGRWTLGLLSERTDLPPGVVRWIAVSAALSLLVSPAVFRQSLSAKGLVYSQALLAMVLILRCGPSRGEGREAEAWKSAFLLGACGAIHWPIAAAGSVLACGGWIRGPRRTPRMLLGVLSVFLLPLSVILYLPLRAIHQPLLDWGHPVHWNSLLWVLRRAPYTELESAPRAWDQYGAQALETVKALGWASPWAPLGLLGLAFWWRRDRPSAWVWGLSLLLPVAAVAGVPRLTTDTFFLIPVYLAAYQGTWMFLGASGLAFLSTLGPRKWGWILAVLALGGWLGWSARLIPRWERSRDFLPVDLGWNTLLEQPRGGILLAEGDTLVLSSLYVRDVLGARKDLDLVPTVFLNEDWGFEKALASLDPPARPPYGLHSFNERVNWFLSLAPKGPGMPGRPVRVSQGKGAFSKVTLDSRWVLVPGGLSYDVSTQPGGPFAVRDRVWGLDQRQRHFGRFDFEADRSRGVQTREIYGFYANQFILSGNLQFASGRSLEASDDYARGLRLDPDSPEAYSNLAVAAGSKGWVDLAETFCRIALEREPGYAGAWDNLGNVRALRGDWNGAYEAYQRALDLDPDNPGTKMNRDRAAERRADASPAAPSSLGDAFYERLAEDFARQQRWMMAEGCFRTACRLGGDNATLWNNLGVTRIQMGDPAGSEAAFRKAMELDPHFVESYKNYGLLLIQLDRKGEAKALLENGAVLDPHQAEIQQLLRQLGGA